MVVALTRACHVQATNKFQILSISLAVQCAIGNDFDRAIISNWSTITLKYEMWHLIFYYFFYIFRTESGACWSGIRPITDSYHERSSISVPQRPVPSVEGFQLSFQECEPFSQSHNTGTARWHQIHGIPAQQHLRTENQVLSKLNR